MHWLHSDSWIALQQAQFRQPCLLFRVGPLRHVNALGAVCVHVVCACGKMCLGSVIEGLSSNSQMFAFVPMCVMFVVVLFSFLKELLVALPVFSSLYLLVLYLPTSIDTVIFRGSTVSVVWCVL